MDFSRAGQLVLLYIGNNAAYNRGNFKLILSGESASCEILVSVSTLQTVDNFSVRAYRMGGESLYDIKTKYKIFYLVDNSIPKVYIKHILERAQSKTLTKYPIDGNNTKMEIVQIDESRLHEVDII